MGDRWFAFRAKRIECPLGSGMREPGLVREWLMAESVEKMVVAAVVGLPHTAPLELSIAMRHGTGAGRTDREWSLVELTLDLESDDAMTALATMTQGICSLHTSAGVMKTKNLDPVLAVQLVLAGIKRVGHPHQK